MKFQAIHRKKQMMSLVEAIDGAKLVHIYGEHEYFVPVVWYGGKSIRFPEGSQTVGDNPTLDEVEMAIEDWALENRIGGRIDPDEESKRFRTLRPYTETIHAYRRDEFPEISDIVGLAERWVEAGFSRDDMEDDFRSGEYEPPETE